MFTTLPVNALRCAEKRISAVSIPITAMTAPTTSSMRSAERVSHQETETGSGVARGEAFPLLGIAFALSLPREREAVNALPFGFAFDLDEVKGILRGIFCSIAQMVCFSFGVQL